MAQLKCIKKNNSRKYYYSIITKWNGVKQETIAFISLVTNNKVTARTRHQKILKKEADIKAGLDYIFSWQKENGGHTEIRIQGTIIEKIFFYNLSLIATANNKIIYSIK